MLGTRLNCSLLIAIGLFAAAAYACASTGETSALPAAVPDGAGGYHARFSNDGATLTQRDGTEVSLHVAAAGREGALATTPKGVPQTEGSRTVYDRGGVREWFERTPNGIEHAFTVAARPPGEGALVVELAIGDSATPALVPSHPTDALLLRRDGTAIAHYGALAAKDAEGTSLDARFELAASRLRIRVADQGATYPITIDPLIWAQQSRLTELKSLAGDLLGAGVAIEGDRIVAGMNGRDTHRGGAAFFERKAGTWSEVSAYSPPDTPLYEERGIGASLQGDTAMLSSAIPAVIFQRDADAGTWTTNGTLEVPSWNTIGGNNGARASFSGDTAVISVSLWEPNLGTPPAPYSGALFLYGKDAGAWDKETIQRIDYPIAPASWTYGNVVIQNDTIVLNEGWTLTVYRRTAGTWAIEATLAPPAPCTGFDNGFALDGDTVVAGCTNLTVPDVAFFVRSGTTWSLQSLLTEPSVQFSWNFGDSAAIRGDVAFVGDWIRNGNGSVFRYARSAGAWALIEEIAPTEAGARFGFELATSADTLAVGAPGAGASRGAIFVYALRSAPGDACTDSVTCASDFCVDGVCCDSACGGGVASDCLACNAPGHLGTCGPAAKASVCRAEAVGGCDIQESCDGTNITCPADAVVANGTTCSAGHCVAGACTTDPPPAIAATPNTAVPVTVPSPAASSGCSASPSAPPPGLALLVVPLALLGLARRRKRRVALMIGAGLATFTAAATADAKLVWSQHQTMQPAPLVSGDGFGGGTTVLDGTTAFVSTFGSYTNVGGVYAYDRNGSDWALSDTIAPADGYAGQGFGKSVAISGDLMAVGAFRDNNNGAVYIFERTATGWMEKQKIIAPAGLGGTFFGWTVALLGNALYIGAPLANGNHGSVLIYGQLGEAQTYAYATTLPGDTDSFSFGSSIAIQGSTLAIGAASFYENVATSLVGHAYIYTGSLATWTLQQKIARPPTESYFKTSFFGTHVALDGNTAIITEGYDFTDPPSGGKAYVYTRVDETWTETQTLLPSDTSIHDGFSSSGDDPGPVLHGDRLLLSSFANNNGQGVAYLFERSGGVWSQTERFVASDASSNEQFGVSGDFSDDMIVLGAPGADGRKGKAYAFFHGSVGDACTSGTPCATGNCVDGVCCDTACGGGDAMDCQACSVNAGAKVDGTCGPTTSHVCRGARDECDAPELCDGVTPTCPADLVASNGKACATGTCSGGQCVAVIPIPATESAPPPDLGSTGAPAAGSDDSGCSTAGEGRSPASFGLVALGLAIALRRRTRRA